MSDVKETLLEEILEKMAAHGTSFPDEFFADVLERLESFGYTLKEEDSWEICFCSIKIENHIKNSCNIDAVPEGLYEIAIDRICGEFFCDRKNSGQLTLGDLDLSGAITSITEGDTTVSFGSSDEETLSAFIERLLTEGEGDLICYRKLKW